MFYSIKVTLFQAFYNQVPINSFPQKREYLIKIERPIVASHTEITKKEKYTNLLENPPPSQAAINRIKVVIIINSSAIKSIKKCPRKLKNKITVIIYINTIIDET
jgi:hypothetical protein